MESVVFKLFFRRLKGQEQVQAGRLNSEMAAEEQAVEFLNNIKLAGSAAEQVQLLKSLQEIVVKRDASLIPTFIPEILELQVDPSPLVRRTLLDFFDAAMQTAPTAATLTSGMQCIQILLQDSVAATVKRAVISAYPTFRASLALTLVQGSPSGGAAAGTQDENAIKQMWNAGLALKDSVVSLALEPISNSAVKLSACKFIEQAAMLLTADIVPAVPAVLPAPRAFPSDNTIVSKSDLVRTGEALVGALNTLLKAATNTDGKQDIAGPLAITCIRAAMNLVQQRPQFLGRILPTLLALSKNSSFAPQKNEPADGGAEASAAPTTPLPSPAVVSALKAALLAAWNSTHAMAKAWKNKVGDALKALGETLPEPVEEDSNKNRVSKRARDTIETAERPTKQAAVGYNGTESAAAAAPMLLQQGGIPSSGPDIAALRQLDSTLRGYIATQNATGIASTISTLPPLVLADLVALYMPNLPARHLLPPDHAPHMPWLDDLMTQLWPPMLEQQQEQQQPPSNFSAPQDPRLAARDGAPAPTAIAPPQDPRLAAAAAAPKLPPMPIPDDIFEPIALTEQEKATMRKNAVVRILQTQKTAANEIRVNLVARLAACSPDSDRVTDAVLEYLFEDFYGRGGRDVALAWLYLLFTEVVGTGHGGGDGVDDGTTDAIDIDEEHVALQNLNNLPGSRYEDVFLSLLEGLKDKVPPSDRTIVFLLTEAPALPEPRVHEFLSSLCAAGGEWATLALIAARDVALTRPPSRQRAVAVALEASISEDVDVRTMAVRLLANRLYPESSMTALIESFAKEQLGKMEAAEEKEKQGNGVIEVKEEKDEIMDEKEDEVKRKDGEIQEAIHDPEAAKTGALALAAEQKAKNDENEASRRCALYCALCTKKHSLLRDLFTSFAALKSSNAKAAVLSNAPGLAKTLGPTAPALIKVIQDPPPGSLDLVLVMLGVLTQSGTPPSMLVNACMQLYKSSKDSRVLAPVLPGMDRTTVLKLLPSILDLPTEMLKQTIARLTTSSGGADGGGAAAALVPAASVVKALFSPSEFLAALHTLETGGDASIIRKSMGAIHICISSPELFPGEELARTINQLLTRSQLPPLFMRTVIQSLAAAPRLRSYVVGILGQLAAKQVWNDTTQWQGWVIAAQQTVPESFPTWLQLPSAVLEKALSNAPAEMKANLAAYAKSPQCQVALAGQTKALLGI
ncbi:putative Symplekin [Nannochloris sp. 'desiccata']|nr:putative Symplekin [Chlorella desiccata (nom. nud.)]